MYDTLSPLIDKALVGNRRLLEFYLREESRLPGSRANLELVNDLGYLLAELVAEQPDNVRALVQYFIRDGKTVESNTPGEFVVLCGIVALGSCAAVLPGWRSEIYELLGHYASSSSWRVREGVAMAFQRLLAVAQQETLDYLLLLATKGNYLQQRASVAAVAEPPLLNSPEIVKAALSLQNVVLGRLHAVAGDERKHEDFRTLRKALGYTVSVVTAAAPEKGFALMCECAAWNDPDINWVLRENLKKKRLAKFVEQSEKLSRLLA